MSTPNAPRQRPADRTEATTQSLFFKRGDSRGGPGVGPNVGREPPISARAGTVLGDFRLRRRIGQGGMGQVWEADQISLERLVAIKLILPSRIDAKAVQLFEREGRAGGRLQHPSIITVHAVGESDGVHYIAQELIDGEWTLADSFGEMRRSTSLPEGYYSAIARFLAETADGLQAAHEEGVIHRDVKPQNILVTPDDHPKIGDFGLARLTDEHSITRTGELAGTYAYMSPEQVTARRVPVDHRTDVFSLGVVMYEALGLVRPFEGDTSQQVAAKILFEDPPPLHTIRSRVPRELALICSKALEKNPGHRYPTAAELAADLRRYLDNEPIRAKPPGPWRRAQKWALRRPAAATAVAVGGAALTVISVLLGANIDARRAAERNAASADANARDTQAALDDVLRLSAIQELRNLRTAAKDGLWPATPDRVDDYLEWMDHARELVQRLDGFEQRRDALRERGGVREGERPTWQFDDARDEWWHGELSKLIEGLRGLADPETGPLGDTTSAEFGWSIPRRLDYATTVEQRTRSGETATLLWDEAIASIADSDACPQYSGLVIPPQLGLVPIGRDPQSGYWEFAHPLSGDVAHRDAEGRLVCTDTMGLVFVLLPGGPFLMGAQRDPSAEHYDPVAEADEWVRELELAPFFMSKYEMTEGQWERFTGTNPSFHTETVPEGPLQPVQQVNWFECDTVLRRMELVMPTEAQWEYAARAGTDTPWWTGAEKEALAGAANVSDQSAARQARWPDFEPWDDGYITLAPVYEFRANPFGLHNVHGNVLEWCYAHHGAHDGAEPVEELWEQPDLRISRGGCCSLAAVYARSSNRADTAPDARNFNLGVRPARPLRHD